jgi:hypothetical protein
MEPNKLKEMFSKENISRQKERLDPAAITSALKNDRYSAICAGLIGLSVLLFLITSMTSTSHPSKLLSKYISAAEEANFETMRELVPSKRYDREAEALGNMYATDVSAVVSSAQYAGGLEIRAGYLDFINKKAQLAESLRKDKTFGRTAYADRKAYVTEKWTSSFGVGTSHVTDIRFNAYGMKTFEALWITEVVSTYRNARRPNWTERQSLDRDANGSRLLDGSDANAIIQYILAPNDRAGIQFKMADIGWSTASAQSQNIVGSMTYSEAMDYDFVKVHGKRLLPLAIRAFYNEAHGVEDKESEIRPAGEGLFQPGQAEASARVKGGIVSTRQRLLDGKWQIESLSDINNVGALYQELRSISSIAPGTTPASNQEG